MSRRKQDRHEEFDIYLCDNCRCIHLEAGDLRIQIGHDDFLAFRDRVNELAYQVDRHALLRDREQFLRYSN